MKFNFKEWEDKKVVMHCSTEKESRDFCRVMHEAGKRWYNGTSYLYRTGWSVLKEEICYNFNEDTFDCRSFYIEGEYKILEWKDYMNNFKKSDLKNGDIIVRRNGKVEIACVETGILITENGRINLLKYIKDDLTSSYSENFDIVEVYRPEEPLQCSFLRGEFQEGNLVYYREPDPIEITLEEIAELKGVPVDKIKIVF